MATAKGMQGVKVRGQAPEAGMGSGQGHTFGKVQVLLSFLVQHSDRYR